MPPSPISWRISNRLEMTCPISNGAPAIMDQRVLHEASQLFLSLYQLNRFAIQAVIVFRKRGADRIRVPPTTAARQSTQRPSLARRSSASLCHAQSPQAGSASGPAGTTNPLPTTNRAGPFDLRYSEAPRFARQAARRSNVVRRLVPAWDSALPSSVSASSTAITSMERSLENAIPSSNSTVEGHRLSCRVLCALA